MALINSQMPPLVRAQYIGSTTRLAHMQKDPGRWRDGQPSGRCSNSFIGAIQVLTLVFFVGLFFFLGSHGILPAIKV